MKSLMIQDFVVTGWSERLGQVKIMAQFIRCNYCKVCEGLAVDTLLYP